MRIALLLFVSVMASTVLANELPVGKPIEDSETVNAIFDRVSVKAGLRDVKRFPESIRCSNRLYSHLNTLVVVERVYGDEFLRKMRVTLSADHSEVLFNGNDGDQMDSLLLKVEDLRRLRANLDKEIPGQLIGGYWWADGDHFTLLDVTCRR